MKIFSDFTQPDGAIARRGDSMAKTDEKQIQKSAVVVESRSALQNVGTCSKLDPNDGPLLCERISSPLPG
jgi:hypothetical protein